jgi:hypothetical protein
MSLFYQNHNPTTSTAQLNPALLPKLANITSQANLEVRVSYFGVCVREAGKSWSCSSNPSVIASGIDSRADPLNLIWIAGRFRSQIVTSIPLYVSLFLQHNFDL